MKAQQIVVRYKQLVDKQEVSQQTYDQAVATAKSSTATYVAAAAFAAFGRRATSHQARAKLFQAQAALRASQTGPAAIAPQAHARSRIGERAREADVT